MIPTQTGSPCRKRSMIALYGRDKPHGSSALVEDSIMVVLGSVAGGVAHGTKVGARIMYIDAFSPTPLFFLYATACTLSQ